MIPTLYNNDKLTMEKREKRGEEASKIIMLKTKQNKTYQQNSNLQGGVHVMCMHPWFFSIGRLHLGHGFELASILKVIKLTVSTRFVTNTNMDTHI